MAKISYMPRHETDPTQVGWPLPVAFDAGRAGLAGPDGWPQEDLSMGVLHDAGIPSRSGGTVLLFAGREPFQKDLSVWLTEQGFAVNALAGGPQMIEACAVIGPACLVLDMDAKEMNGFAVLAELRRCHAGVPVIVVSAQAEVPRVVRAMRLGAFDFLPKPHDPEELRQAIGWALQQAGTMQDSPASAELIRQRLATLTPRERDVLRSVARGCLNKQVASQLGLALVTVKVHRASAMRKMGVKTPAELGRVAELAGF